MCKKGFHVVGSLWLENCLERGQKLQEDQYSLKPGDVEETNLLECKLDQVMSASPESKIRQKGCKEQLEKSVSVVTPNYGNRKRGRPASKNTKKEKMVVRQARRVPRRRGKVSVKINEDWSDESGSDDKTNEEEMEKGERNTESYGMVGRENYEFHQNQAVEDMELSRRAKTVEEEAAENASEKWLNKASDVVMCETNDDQGCKKAEKLDLMEVDERDCGHDSAQSEKLEVMVDPVQAMLLDMIPSLGMKRVETTNSVVENEKPRVDNNAEIPAVEDDKLDADIISPPVKKKKVSYKDIAGKLLNDW